MQDNSPTAMACSAHGLLAVDSWSNGLLGCPSWTLAMVTLTKYQTLTKPIREDELSRNTTKNHHENTDANLVATLFSWGWPSRTPATKRICGGELSWKCDFRVSIIVSVDAWQCTLTHYFRESKTTFRDVFSTLTKYLVSSSERHKRYQNGKAY